MGLNRTELERVRLVPCIKCGHKIKTIRNIGYLFCYRCGELTRLNKYKYKVCDEPERIDEAWVFRD